jgi:probable phosphoglycerate mutase
MSTTQFWLIRHGETQWNAELRLQGWRDIPLNPTGIEQAARVAEGLRASMADTTIHAVISSDLRRAMETARLATRHLDLPIQANAELRERNFGIYEGQDWKILGGGEGRTPIVDFRNPDQEIEEGESLPVFEARIVQAFEALAEQYRGQNVMVFSHGGVIDIAWRRTTGVCLRTPRADKILNASINHFGIDAAREWTAVNWGQVAHLEANTLEDVL